MLPIGSAQGAASVPQDFTDSPFIGGLTNPTDMEFAPDGRLFVTEQAGRVRIVKPDGTLATFLNISTGDNETQDKAQQLTNLFGKMLRINKDGTIPTDNPFYSKVSGKQRAIWALGLRNPFKFAIQLATDPTSPDTIYINDVGEDSWEEVNRGAAGANYGWNIYEGPESDPQYVNPIFAYGHDGDVETTGCSITGGVFYNPKTLQYPSEYVGDYFFADFCSGWIRRLDTSTGVVSDFAKEIVHPIDLEVSKEGELYYLSRGASSTPGSVGKIRYSGTA